MTKLAEGTDVVPCVVEGKHLKTMRHNSAACPAEVAPEDTEKSVLTKHIEAICEEAGLGVMVQVYEILLDREEIDPVAILALSGQNVQDHYFAYIGPAIDSVEASI